MNTFGLYERDNIAAQNVLITNLSPHTSEISLGAPTNSWALRIHFDRTARPASISAENNETKKRLRMEMKMILYIVVASMSWAFTRGHWLLAGFGLKNYEIARQMSEFWTSPNNIWLWFSDMMPSVLATILLAQSDRYSAWWKVAEALLKFRELTCERSDLMAHFELVFTHNRPSSFCVHWTIDLLLNFF